MHSAEPLMVQHLVEHGEFVAVSDVSFSTRIGEIFGITGPGAAGTRLGRVPMDRKARAGRTLASSLLANVIRRFRK